jgi:hypothetical protein
MTTEEKQKEIDDECERLWPKPSIFKKIKNTLDWRIRKVKRLYRLLKAFWSVCYYDYTTITIHLEHCFEEMIAEYERHKEAGWEHTSYERDLRILKICKHLSGRIANNDYRSKYQDRADAQWERREDVCYMSEDPTCIFNAIDPLGEPSWGSKCLEDEQNLAQADQELLFKLLSKHLQKLWI